MSTRSTRSTPSRARAQPGCAKAPMPTKRSAGAAVVHRGQDLRRRRPPAARPRLRRLRSEGRHVGNAAGPAEPAQPHRGRADRRQGARVRRPPRRRLPERQDRRPRGLRSGDPALVRRRADAEAAERHQQRHGLRLRARVGRRGAGRRLSRPRLLRPAHRQLDQAARHADPDPRRDRRDLRRRADLRHRRRHARSAAAAAAC